MNDNKETKYISHQQLVELLRTGKTLMNNYPWGDVWLEVSE